MRCPECGNPAEQGNVFCASCGTRIEQIPSIKTDNPIPKPKLKPKKFLIIAGAVGVIGMAAIAVIITQVVSSRDTPTYSDIPANSDEYAIETPLNPDNYAEASQSKAVFTDDIDTVELQLEADYEAAKALLESGDYDAAALALAELGDYKDASVLMNNIRLYEYSGMYRNLYGEGMRISMNDNGQLEYLNEYFDIEIDVDNIQEDGSILAFEGPAEHNIAPTRMYIYPVGVPLTAYNNDTFEDVETDTSKLRLFWTYSDVPDIRSNVYYKAEPLPSDAFSYLPKPNMLHEFASAGIIPANGQEWGQFFITEYEETSGGDIKEITISATEDGKPVDVKYFNHYIYYEDATGLYRSPIITEFSTGLAELCIKYPLAVGEEFQSSQFYGTGVVEAIDETITTAAGVFENVVVVSYEFGEGGYGETQYFAPGIGLIKYQAIRSSGELISIGE